MNIGERIKALRNAHGMSAEELADRIGISAATLYRYENGDIREPRYSIICKIASVCGTEADEVFQEEKDAFRDISSIERRALLNEFAEALENAAAIARKIANEIAGPFST